MTLVFLHRTSSSCAENKLASSSWRHLGPFSRVNKHFTYCFRVIMLASLIRMPARWPHHDLQRLQREVLLRGGQQRQSLWKLQKILSRFPQGPNGKRQNLQGLQRSHGGFESVNSLLCCIWTIFLATNGQVEVYLDLRNYLQDATCVNRSTCNEKLQNVDGSYFKTLATPDHVLFNIDPTKSCVYFDSSTESFVSTSCTDKSRGLICECQAGN